jgi:tetratricopeptide (TPR) repeat protein
MESRDVINLVVRADRERAAGRYEVAIDLLRRALSADPDHTSAHASLALALVGARRLHAADREAELALLGGPEDGFAHYAAAAVRLAQRRLDQAWEHCALAMMERDRDADTLVLAAEIRRHQNRHGEAAGLLDEALAAAPENVQAMVTQAWVAIERDEIQEATLWSERALVLDPADLGAHVVAGHLALRRGALDDATGHVRFALSESPNDPEVIALFAGLQARRNPVLGLWWRWIAWVGLGSERRQLSLLIGIYLVAQTARILAGAAGADGLASILSWAWLLFCAYTWTAPELFRRRVERELASVHLRDDF